MDQQFWDELYGSREQLFSGAVNGVLVTETAELPVGRALDLGCGEGGDALWLAGRGWQVTATDISRTALDRAAATAAEAGLTEKVTWTHADLSRTPPAADSFDLVNAHYFPLEVEPGHAALRALLAAVAPGGTLLYVGHDVTGLTADDTHGFDPHAFYKPAEVAALLDDRWTVLVDETRARTTPAPEGTHHTHDTVLRARRRD
ncbi:class I SAM-dependent methyltransferase [Streptomyces sp. XM4193]|uniref:class I SAM-dependent methyltransferase n=1 Tax=Streptomyces sp. XM4193 TaxID=2929782 RepID=UPI001FF720B9|nr:class I SAM-dependent methyltransferase [Streptomyces sp. XM4193]MCK1794637.1 class I SAM-dependent methyltransferase [Streptomyces sp. XM4193]